MFTAAYRQASDLPKTGPPIKQQREWPAKKIWTWSCDLWIPQTFNKKVTFYEYQVDQQKQWECH